MFEYSTSLTDINIHTRQYVADTYGIVCGKRGDNYVLLSNSEINPTEITDAIAAHVPPDAEVEGLAKANLMVAAAADRARKRSLDTTAIDSAVSTAQSAFDAVVSTGETAAQEYEQAAIAAVAALEAV